MRFELIVEKIVEGARTAVVTIAILALGISGAGAAERLLTEVEAEETSSVSASDQVELVAGVDAEEDAGGMATDGRPWTEQVATLKSSLQVPGGNDQYRSMNARTACLPDLYRHTAYDSSQRLAATTGRVCWLLSRQFTLLGAKPSGTS